MTDIDKKRDEIREGIVNCLRMQVGAIPNDKVENCYEIQPYWKGVLVTNILKYLHSRDVCFKVDRELPIEVECESGVFELLHENETTRFPAVEPLIEVE